MYSPISSEQEQQINTQRHSVLHSPGLFPTVFHFLLTFSARRTHINLGIRDYSVRLPHRSRGVQLHARVGTADITREKQHRAALERFRWHGGGEGRVETAGMNLVSDEDSSTSLRAGWTEPTRADRS